MKKKALIALLALASGLFGISSLHALTVSPARLELTGDPGKTISGEFLLVNEQEDTKTFYSSAENFEAQGETGTPTFTTSNTGLASWITVERSVTLKKGEQVTVPFTISIPADAPAGGHFAAIFLSTAPPQNEGGQVSVGAKIGVLVFLKVSGEIKEGGGISNFSTKSGKSFFTALPVEFAYHFANSGNDRVHPEGMLTIRNTFGMKTAEIAANESKGNVLPQSTRRFDLMWGEAKDSSETAGFFKKVSYEWRNFAFGKYKAHLSLAYGAEGAGEATKTIFILPWELLLVILIAIGGVLLLFIQGLKRYNRWIIKKARGAR